MLDAESKADAERSVSYYTQTRQEEHNYKLYERLNLPQAIVYMTSNGAKIFLL
jgi:hypothetical protein